MMFERTICFQSFLFREKQTAKSYMWAKFSLRSSFISESYGSLFFFTAHYSPIQGTIQQSDLNSWVLILCLGFTVCLASQSCPTVWDSMDHNLPGSSVHGDSRAKNTGVSCHAFLQGIFPTQGSNPGLPYCRWNLYCLSHQGSLVLGLIIIK